MKQITPLRGVQHLANFPPSDYVYHGSSTLLDQLEPRVAINKGKSDGAAAIFATEHLEIALFHALVAPYGWSNTNVSSTELKALRTDQQTFTTAKTSIKPGYIYVFEKTNFHKFSGEYRCKHPIKPVAIVEVTSIDIPQNIEIKPRPQQFQ